LEAALKINEWVVEKYKWSRINEVIQKMISKRKAAKDSVDCNLEAALKIHEWVV
jgi:hypothetical protein